MCGVVGRGWEGQGSLVLIFLLVPWESFNYISEFNFSLKAERLGSRTPQLTNFVTRILAEFLPSRSWLPNLEQCSVGMLGVSRHMRGVSSHSMALPKQILSLFHPFHSEKGIVPMCILEHES